MAGSPVSCTCPVPGTPQPGRKGAETLRRGSAVSSLSLSQAAAAGWDLWPILNEGCAFERGDFQVVNYRERLPLLLKSQRCAAAPFPTVKLGCHPGRGRRTHRWTPALLGLLAHPLLCWAAARGAAGCPAPCERGLGQLWGSGPGPHPRVCYPEQLG